jgi:hypothetical protein
MAFPFSALAASVVQGQYVEVIVGVSGIEDSGIDPTYGSYLPPGTPIYYAVVYDTSEFSFVEDSIEWLSDIQLDSTQDWFIPPPSQQAYIDTTIPETSKVTNGNETGTRLAAKLLQPSSQVNKDTGSPWWYDGEDFDAFYFFTGDVTLFSFRLKALGNVDTSGIVVKGNSGHQTTYSINVLDGSAPPTTMPGYTIGATSGGGIAANVTMGATFSVDVGLTADPEAVYATAYTELIYDPEKVTPELAGFAEIVDVEIRDSESPGQLTIINTADEGNDVPVDSDGVLLATIPFTANNMGEAIFSVSENAYVTVSGNDDDTITATPGENLIVNIDEAEPEIGFMPYYAGLPDGYTLLTYTVSSADAGYVWTYGGKDMHNITVDGQHYVTYIVADTTTEETASTPVKTDGSYTTIYDVGGNGDVNIGDLQLVYDIINKHDNYKQFEGLGIAPRLNADVNGDGEVTVADASALIDFILSR